MQAEDITLAMSREFSPFPVYAQLDAIEILKRCNPSGAFLRALCQREDELMKPRNEARLELADRLEADHARREARR